MNEVQAPLFNGAVTDIKWLPFFLKCTCEIYSNYHTRIKTTKLNSVKNDYENEEGYMEKLEIVREDELMKSYIRGTENRKM